MIACCECGRNPYLWIDPIHLWTKYRNYRGTPQPYSIYLLEYYLDISNQWL